ncbi:DUF4238 domain-containing protein [Paraburkholderia sp. BR10954]|uniref:DUF4238 domain-containing protein n=1 Tax=Paraburkholderia sp. BR10954 TaxID=3236995 RepID=UPI0034D2122F
MPASYMKAWCDPDRPPNHEPFVWVFERDGSSRVRRAPHKLFTETDLYTIEDADGNRDLRIEATLSTIEDRFVRMRNSKFNFRRELTPEEHIYLCMFVAAAQIRTTASRDHHAAQWGHVLKVTDDLAESMARASPEEQARIAQALEPPSAPYSSLTHEQVRQLATKPLQHMIGPTLRITVPVLQKMDAAIFCTDDPIGFITSDAPCTWFDPEAYKLPPFYRSPGLGIKTIEVTMPISPQQCLCLNWQGWTGYIDTPMELVDDFNRRHRYHCKEHFVVCRDSQNAYWFQEGTMPDDAWEKLHPPTMQERTKGSSAV